MNSNSINPQLYEMLIKKAEYDASEARMSLKILSDHPAGIGDHSTGDFYSNAHEALAKLAEAEDRIECLKRNYSPISSNINS